MPKEHYTDLARLEALLVDTAEGSLATVGADGQPYITVVNHLYVPAKDKHEGNEKEYGKIYFHCAPSGRKLENILHEPRVCFSTYKVDRVAIGKHSCECTVYYNSVMGFGNAAIVKDDAVKQTILNSLTEKYAGHHLPPAPNAAIYARTTLVEISLNELTGKRKSE